MALVRKYPYLTVVCSTVLVMCALFFYIILGVVAAIPAIAGLSYVYQRREEFN